MAKYSAKNNTEIVRALLSIYCTYFHQFLCVLKLCNINSCFKFEENFFAFSVVVDCFSSEVQLTNFVMKVVLHYVFVKFKEENNINIAINWEEMCLYVILMTQCQ